MHHTWPSNATSTDVLYQAEESLMANKQYLNVFFPSKLIFNCAAYFSIFTEMIQFSFYARDCFLLGRGMLGLNQRPWAWKCSTTELHLQSLKQCIVLTDYELLINFIFLEWILLVIFLSDNMLWINRTKVISTY